MVFWSGYVNDTITMKFFIKMALKSNNIINWYISMFYQKEDYIRSKKKFTKDIFVANKKISIVSDSKKRLLYYFIFRLIVLNSRDISFMLINNY